MSLPFERQDISSGADKHRATRDSVSEGERFVCLFDQTYGSLRLTSHLMEPDVLRDVFARAVDIARHDQNFSMNSETLAALDQMAESVTEEPEQIGAGGASHLTGQFVEVILPGSVGIDIQKDNEEFCVEGVFFSPQFGKLTYRGKHLYEKKKAESTNAYHGPTSVMVPVENVRPLEGESKTGFYNFETGETLDHIPQGVDF